MLKIDLTKRVALVLGGSRGIGAGIVETLGQAGACVVFTHRGEPRRTPELDEFLARIRRSGTEVKAISADACDSEATAGAVQQSVAAYGRIDHLVCVVGQTLKQPAQETSDEKWHRFLDINLGSAFYAVRSVLPHMLTAGYGRIILIGSSAVYDGGGGAIEYSAAKAGLVGMAAHLTRCCTRRGILTNVIHPCVIDTDLLRERYGDPESKKRLISQVPAGRLGTTADIANLVAFLLSPMGDFICNQSILVDGGRTLFHGTG